MRTYQNSVETMSDFAPQHKYQAKNTMQYLVAQCKIKGHKEMKKIAESIIGFFGVVVNGIIDGRQRQAEYIAKNHHWY